MNELVRQAARMQRKIDAAKKQIKDTEVEGAAAGGKVRAYVSCEGKVKRLVIEPDFLASEGLELALDALTAATNHALDAADKMVDAEVAKVTGGVKIPGM